MDHLSPGPRGPARAGALHPPLLGHQAVDHRAHPPRLHRLLLAHQVRQRQAGAGDGHGAGARAGAGVDADADAGAGDANVDAP